MTCDRVDELAAAYALGAVDAEEEREIAVHLPNARSRTPMPRQQIGVAAAGAGRSISSSRRPALRGDSMATIAATPPGARVLRRPRSRSSRSPSNRSAVRAWQVAPLRTALAAAAVAAAVGLGAWGVSLDQQLAERDAALRAVASADTAYAVSGSAGSGWVIESDGQAIFLAESLAELPADQIYELWLIGPDDAPVAVGTIPKAMTSPS